MALCSERFVWCNIYSLDTDNYSHWIFLVKRHVITENPSSIGEIVICKCVNIRGNMISTVGLLFKSPSAGTYDAQRLCTIICDVCQEVPPVHYPSSALCIGIAKMGGL